LAARLSEVRQAESPSVKRRDVRELIEEILELTRKDYKYSMSCEFSEDRVPKDAVWKTIHDKHESDIRRMTNDDLHKFREMLRTRRINTPYMGEEDSLESKIRLVDSVISGRNPTEEATSLKE
jgi:hypothetical protein